LKSSADFFFAVHHVALFRRGGKTMLKNVLSKPHKL